VKRASFLLAATVGGVFGALSSQLLSEVIPQDSLASSAAETERILDILGERTNILDVNQKRMAVLIERIQRQMQQEMSDVTRQVYLSTMHLQINSVLIHLGDHLSYLYYLLSSGEAGDGVNLALSEMEREQILQRRANTSGGSQAVAGTPVRHRFQMLDEDLLCVIIEVPIRTSTVSTAAIRVYPFPIIRHGALQEPQLSSGYFLHFAGGFFVEMDGPNFYKCLDTGSCSGVAPLQYADGNSGCHIAQYFGEGEAGCSYVKISRRNFLLHTGRTIVHALLDPMTLRLSCDHEENDSVRRVTG